MTIIPDPNWLSVASAVFVLTGICFLAKGLLSDPAAQPDERALRIARATRTVDMGLGLPLVVVGAVLNVLSALVLLPFNWIATALLLTLAYGLLIYLATHELIVDRLVAQVAPKPQRAPAKIAFLPSPVVETREVAPEPRVAEVAAQGS